MRKTFLTLVLALAIPVAACGKKEEAAQGAAKGTGPAATGGGGDTAKAPDLGAPTWKKMDKLGLQIEVPASAEFMDTSADAPGAQFFTGNNECSVRVNQTTEAFTNDFDKAKAEVEKDPGTKFVKWIKADKIEGGWHFEWEGESGFEPGKKLYGVQIRRTFGDKQVECWEKAESPDRAACTVKACLSIKPL
jgi:hypothetical protein